MTRMLWQSFGWALHRVLTASCNALHMLHVALGAHRHQHIGTLHAEGLLMLLP